jgi:hypothetical protein
VIVGRFPLDVVGSFHGAFESRMCLDGTCRTARGVLDPHEGSLGQTVNRFVQSGVEVTAFEDEIEVQMNLPTGRYDDVTSHRIVVELTRENQDPLAIDTQTRFERNQPNGAACGPTCWLADLSWIAPRSP